jgi:hypothetical protein
LRRSTQQFQHFSQQTPHVPNHHRDRLGALMRNDSQVHPNGCFNCGELEWYTSICQIITSRLPRKIMVKGSDNQHLRYTMEVQILRSTRVNGITCVADWTTWQLNKFKTLLELCGIRFLSTLCLQRFYLIPEHYILSLLSNSWQSMIYLWVLWRHICWLVPRTVK